MRRIESLISWLGSRCQGLSIVIETISANMGAARLRSLYHAAIFKALFYFPEGTKVTLLFLESRWDPSGPVKGSHPNFPKNFFPTPRNV
jgi:hypothetical protein